MEQVNDTFLFDKYKGTTL